MSEQKVVVVTGGAGGIGIETGKIFRREGWKVVLVDINAEALESAAAQIGEGTETAVLDIRNVAQIREVFAALGAKLGRLD